MHPEGYEFIEGQDCLLHKFVEQLPSGAKHCIEYLISLDMTKELAMEENNERGRQARQYFIDVEKCYRHTGCLEENHPCRPYAKLSAKMNNTAHVWNWSGTSCPTAIPATSIRRIAENKFRRSCYVARNGRDISLLMENPTLPGLFEEIPINLMSGQFGTLSETAA